MAAIYDELFENGVGVRAVYVDHTSKTPAQIEAEWTAALNAQFPTAAGYTYAENLLTAPTSSFPWSLKFWKRVLEYIHRSIEYRDGVEVHIITITQP